MAPPGEAVPMVQVLVESGLNEVPKRFVKPPEDRPSTVVSDGSDEVPVISGSELESEEGIRKLDKACREWGFFQLVDHGISSSLIEETKKVVKEFFTMPQSKRDEYAIRDTEDLIKSEGYGRYFVHSEDAVLDWEDTVYHFLPPLRGWPTHPPKYKEIIQAYSEEVRSLLVKVLIVMSKALNQAPNFFSDAFGANPHFALRLNYYPPCPEPELVMGLSPHSDPLGLTVLLQNEIEGLQIKKDGQWKPVKVIPDAFVINVGDTLEVLSNGIYKSVEHRAVVNSEKPRISVAAIHGADIETVLKPLSVEGVPGVYREIPMQELLITFLGDKLKGKKHHISNACLCLDCNVDTKHETV